MAGLWHFLEGADFGELVNAKTGEFNRAVLKRHKLDQELRDVRTHPDDAVATAIKSGPGNQAGVMLYPMSPRSVDVPGNPAFDAACQFERIEKRRRWIGWNPQRPPDPLDLERSRLCEGYFCGDRHGRRWIVPAARGGEQYGPTGGLPFEYLFGEAHDPVARVLPAFEQFWADAQRVHDHLHDVKQESPAWLARMVARAIAVNYRLGDHELGIMSKMGLGIVDSDFLLHALMSIVDYDAPADYVAQKKKLGLPVRRAGSDSRPGSPAARPDIAQRSAS